MKKNLLALSLALLVTFTSSSQVSITTAPDFTVTDTEGHSHNLYTILNSGKYVCVDFFFTTCPPCISTVPFFKQSYTNFGCNTEDIFFISIDNGDSNAEVIAFENDYVGGNSGYPTVSGDDGGGNAVNVAYNPAAYPTYILIAPNKQIIETDMWPIDNAASFTTFFATHNLAPKSCAITGINNAQETIENVTIYPNPVLNNVHIKTNENLKSVKVFDVLGNLLLNETISSGNQYEINMSSFQTGVYFVEINSEKGAVIKKIHKK